MGHLNFFSVFNYTIFSKIPGGGGASQVNFYERLGLAEGWGPALKSWVGCLPMEMRVRWRWCEFL